MLLAEICPLLYQGLWIDIFLQNVRSCEANSFNFPQTHSSVQIVFPAMMHDYSCNRSFHVYIKDWSTIMEIKSPKYGTYRGHEGGDYTNILFPMGGGICNKVQLFHSSLCPRGGGGGGSMETMTGALTLKFLQLSIMFPISQSGLAVGNQYPGSGISRCPWFFPQP